MDLPKLSWEDTIAYVQSNSDWMPYKSKPKGYLLIALGTLLMIAFFSVYLYFQSEMRALRILGELFRFIAAAAIIGIPTYALIFPGMKMLKPDGITILKKHNYVLYLRQFSLDYEIKMNKKLINWTELFLSKAFREYGDLLALGGREGEMAVGGYRVFVKSDTWQTIVFNLVSHAKLVIINLTESAQVEWELQICRQYCDPTRLLVLIEEDIATRIEILNRLNISAYHLASSENRNLFIAFNSNWEPYCPYERVLKYQTIRLGLLPYLLGSLFRLDRKPLPNRQLRAFYKTNSFIFLLTFTAFTTISIPISDRSYSFFEHIPWFYDNAWLYICTFFALGLLPPFVLTYLVNASAYTETLERFEIQEKPEKPFGKKRTRMIDDLCLILLIPVFLFVLELCAKAIGFYGLSDLAHYINTTLTPLIDIIVIIIGIFWYRKNVTYTRETLKRIANADRES